MTFELLTQLLDQFTPTCDCRERWASRVRRETENNLQQFYKSPGDFRDSIAYFRMLMLVTVLQQDFGVHYNLQRIDNVDFTKSQDLFIHGLVGSANGGTCVSMPVLYTVLARRLGYPVFLVNAKGHLFCRWDGQGERLNIEGSSRGMNCYDDQYYMSWPHPISKDEVDLGLYLKSLSVPESFAVFLASRGHCLADNGNHSEAILSYSLAVKHSGHPMYRGFLARLVRPKTLEDFPELLAQQERLQKQIRGFGELAPTTANAFPTVYPFSQPNQTFNNDPASFFRSFPNGVTQR